MADQDLNARSEKSSSVKTQLQLNFSGKCIITLNDTRSRDVLVKETENAYFLQKVGSWVSEFLGGTSGSITIR